MPPCAASVGECRATNYDFDDRSTPEQGPGGSLGFNAQGNISLVKIMISGAMSEDVKVAEEKHGHFIDPATVTSPVTGVVT